MVRIPFSSTVLQRRRGYRRVLSISPGFGWPRRSRSTRRPCGTCSSSRTSRSSTSFGPSSASFTNSRCWRAHPFDRGGRPAITSGPISRPTGPSNGLQVCAWCTTSTSPGRTLGVGVPTRYRCAPISRFRSPTGRTPASTFSTRNSVYMGSPTWDLPGPTRTGTTRRSERERERAGSFKRGDIYKMHAYRNAIPDARSVWILYPGGEFRFFGIPGSSVQSGHQAVSSPEGLPEELQCVGAIPLGLVVGDTTGRGRRGEDANDDSLRQTLRRMLGDGG